jgi:nucleotide-binding universal stress UspA family protein
MAKRILVPLSMHEPADSFVTAVGDLARGAGATVRLLHVAPTPEHVTDVNGRLVAYADQEAVRLDTEARDHLETIAIRFDGVPIECVVRFGDPAREIVVEAAQFGADLIALGVDRRRRVLPSRVTGGVLRRTDTPVALFRAGRHESSR